MSTATERITARVQLNPDYATLDASWLAELVARAQSVVVGYCNLSEFPEVPDDEPALEDAAVILTEVFAAKQGLEGMASGTLPHGVTFTADALDPQAKKLLNSKRRLWAT